MSVARRIVDIGMTVLLLCLMAYQVTGETAHEWIGMGMTVLVVVHQLLNRRWYGALFRGKYHALRVWMTVVNLLLLASFVLTAFCGMAMSGHAVPFLYGMAPVSFARRMHLSMSHWAFVLMGVHLGLHLPVITAGMHFPMRVRNILLAAATILAGVGLYFFLKNGVADYLFFRVPFALLDYGKPAVLVFLENIFILFLWVFIGNTGVWVCRKIERKDNR